MEYTLEAASAFAEHLAPRLKTEQKKKKKFRFLYLSGHFTEKDQEKHLLVMAENKKIRGQVEVQLLQLVKDHGISGVEMFLA